MGLGQSSSAAGEKHDGSLQDEKYKKLYKVRSLAAIESLFCVQIKICRS